MDADQEESQELSTFQRNAVPIGIALVVTLALAVDDLNPVKVLCTYARWFDEGSTLRICVGCVTENSIAILTLLTLLTLMVMVQERLIYYLLKLFFRCTFNNMFFRSIEIVGGHNLPKSGPVILTGNHNNQFVDGMNLLANCERQISFMIAKKSWDKPFVGFFAKIFRCLPVTRAMDTIFTGKGTITTEGNSAVVGKGTKFLDQVQVGALINFEGLEKPIKVKSISSDTLLLVEGEAPSSNGPVSYKVTPKLDQSSMYDQVFSGLAKGRCLGIFPEGGSHDQTDLLPLKAGVAIIALEAYRKHYLTVPIVPVGLNYFQGHKFGGRVVIEFGPPIVVPESLYTLHETDKRGATDALLKLVMVGMRSCIVPTTNFKMLQQIYTLRRLYVPDGLKLSAEQTMDLNRRFAVGIHRLLDMRHDAEKDELMGGASAEPDSPKEKRLTPADRCAIDEFKAEVEDYMATLKRLGLQDHQVRQIGWWGIPDLVGRIVYAVFAIGLGAFPQIFFNLPVMAVASHFAAIEQKKALKTSTVKLKGMDVVMSYKAIYSLMMVPVLYFLYGLLYFFVFKWCLQTVFIMMIIIPTVSVLGAKASEQGMRAYKDIGPLMKRLLPESRREQDALPARRALLQKKLNAGIRRWGPLLGDLYKLKTVNWVEEMGWFTHAAERDDKSDEKVLPAGKQAKDAEPA